MRESKNENENSMEDPFGPVIYAYTRAQAIADGVLVDVTKTAQEAGIKLPTAITTAVNVRYVEVPEELKGQQDEAGRRWDLLWMLSHAVRSGKLAGSEGMFELLVAMPASADWEANEKTHGGNLRLVTLKAVCGPSDDGSACLTIMKPDED